MTEALRPTVRVAGLAPFRPSAIRLNVGPYTITQASVTFGRVLPRLTPKDIVREVARRYGLTLDEITSHSRSPVIAHPRQEAMHELRDRTKLSLPQIARLLGLKNHTTVIHGIRQHEARSASRRVGEP